jgi:oligosaccharide repeat unit polymerase
MYDIDFAIAVLFLLAVWVCKTTYKYGCNYGFYNYSILIRILFLVVYVLSGLCHLILLKDERGFFDSYLYAKMFPNSFYNLQSALLLTLFYFVLTSVQSQITQLKRHSVINSIFQNRTFLLYGILLLFIGIVASLALSGAVNTAVIERGRELPKGIAKFVFISTWFGWGITFIVFALLKKYKLSNLNSAIIFYVAVILIVLNVMWMGGRSAIVLLNLPLFFVLVFLRKKLFKKIALSLLVPFIFYVSYISDVRKEGYQNNETSINQVIDWEFGRFSMLPYSMNFVDRKDYLFGAPYFDAIIKTLASPIYFLGGGAEFVGKSEGSTVYEVGNDLFYHGDITYVVPGAIPEAYMNFGIVGIIFIALIFGIISKYIDLLMFRNIGRPYHFIFYAYVGSVLCFNFFNSTFFAFLNYLTFTGAPLVLMFVLSNLLYVRLKS